MSYRYFHDTPDGPVRLRANNIQWVPLPQFVALGGIPNKSNRDSGHYAIGQRLDGTSFEWLPVSRAIRYRTDAPSLHECNAKCMNGRENGTCECRCGGKNHARGSVLMSQLVA